MNEVFFTDKEFEVLRKFQNKMNAVFGESAYVGASYATVVLEYSPALFANLRPLPENKQYNYEVKLLPCKDCKKTALYLALVEEQDYVCNACIDRRKKNG